MGTISSASSERAPVRQARASTTRSAWASSMPFGPEPGQQRRGRVIVGHGLEQLLQAGAHVVGYEAVVTADHSILLKQIDI